MAAWEHVKVGNFLFAREGKYKPDAEEISGLLRVEKINFSGQFHLATKPSKTNMIRIEPGDLVISGINVAKGALGVYEGNEPVTATIHYSSYSFDEKKINVEYFKRFLKSSLFTQLLKEQVKGGIKTEIKPKHLLPLVIPLPSINEQKNILSRFMCIEREDKELKSHLEYQQTLLKKLRQQILQEAIEGKLTADWRAAHPDVEPASKLLKRIAAEKAELIKAGKIKKQKPLLPITEEEKPFELPEGWEWCRLGGIANVVRGGSPRPAGDKRFYEGDIPFLKVADLTATSDMLLESHTYTIKKAGLNKTRRVSPNTLMLTNSGATLGIPKICTFETTFNDGVAAFIYMNDGLYKAYFYNVLLSKTLWFLEEASRGQGQPNLNTDIIGNTIIYLPSTQEQKAISTKVEKFLAICDDLEAQISQNQTHAEALMQAVLHEAFNQMPKTKKPAEARPSNNIVPFKPKGVDYYKRTLLAAEIVYQLHREPTMGHLKLQKLIYLCQKTETMRLPTQFLQQAAGPYDPKMARSIDKQLKHKKWFSYNKLEMPKYTPLEQAGEHQVDFDKYFVRQKAGIYALIQLFRKTKSDKIEIVATLYACWEDILKKQEVLSGDLLIQRFYGWSKEKGKYTESRIRREIEWMKRESIVPDAEKLAYT